MDLLISSLGIPNDQAGWALLQTQQPTSFNAFMQDPVLKQQIAYFEANAPKATTAQALLNDPQLQDFALTAFGLTSENGLTALMEKVLNSDTTQSNSFASQMNAPEYTAIAKAFNYGGATTAAQPAVASSANVMLDGMGAGGSLGTFSGSFGGVTLSNVDLSGDTTPQQVAATLQAAFQRSDGNRTDITVKNIGFQLVFSDAKGRGTANGFSFTTGSGGVTAESATNLVTGSTAVAATGGPNVTNPTFIQQMVQLYTQAQFQAVVGNTSNSLREALYAKQQLPNVTNWYSVMADPPLADVIQTVLGLPSSFGTLNVDQQAQIYASRMNIKDFQNPTKLNALLNQYVVMAQASGTDTPTTNSNGLAAGVAANPAVTLLSTASGVSASATYNTLSPGNIAMLLLSNATNGGSLSGG